MVQRDRVDRGVDVAAGQQRRQRGGEPQPVRGLRQVQRLDAEPVAGQDQPAAVLLQDGEREHPEEVVDAVHPPPVVGLGDDLGVGAGEEAVAVALQFLAQLLVVVDAAVEHRDQPQRRVHHRLGAGRGEVDDGQPPVRERDRAVVPQPVPVRAARLHHRRDARHRVDVGRAAVEPDLTAHSAHEVP